MIKFFRHIRKQLLTESKFSKYLLYAIGEIVLVMVGILLALQINNWNEHRKDRLQEQELLGQLQSEFQSNLLQLDQKISLRKDMIVASLKLLDYIDHPEKRIPDSIVKYIMATQIAPTFDPIVNDLISSGRIQLLQNQELKEKLSLWTSEIVQVTEEEGMWAKYRTESYVPFLIENTATRTITNQFWKNNTLGTFHLDDSYQNNFSVGNSKHPVGLSELMNNRRFEGHVAQSASFAELTNSQSNSLRSRIIEILELIQKDIHHD